ncbi:MAG: RidA family protein [Bacilli bacterium]
MKKLIFSDNAPAAIGPYAHAVDVNGTIYVSGQLPVDPVTNEVVSGGVASETKQSLANVEAILKDAGYSKNDVVKATIYLRDMNDFAAVNEVYGAFFDGHTPARVAIEVARLPKDVAVEIDAIAIK